MVQCNKPAWRLTWALGLGPTRLGLSAVTCNLEVTGSCFLTNRFVNSINRQVLTNIISNILLCCCFSPHTELKLWIRNFTNVPSRARTLATLDLKPLDSDSDWVDSTTSMLIYHKEEWRFWMWHEYVGTLWMFQWGHHATDLRSALATASSTVRCHHLHLDRCNCELRFCVNVFYIVGLFGGFEAFQQHFTLWRCECCVRVVVWLSNGSNCCSAKSMLSIHPSHYPLTSVVTSLGMACVTSFYSTM